MRKLIKNKMLAMLLACVMIMGVLPVSAFATETASDDEFSDDEFKVVISLEGFTLGQGFYVEPKAYTLDEINALIESEGYGPYTEDELTAAMATLAMLIDNGLEYTSSGTWESSIYLASVKDIDTGILDIPAFITENSGISNENNTGNADEYLGEKDYFPMSGWMYIVNDCVCGTGASKWTFATKSDTTYGKTYVVRWQFTLWGYGTDLGLTTTWYTRANKDLLYIAYAECTNEEAKEAVLPVMTNLLATEEEIAAALVTLETAAETTTTETTTTGTTTAGTTTIGTKTTVTTVDDAQDDSTVSDETLAQATAAVTALPDTITVDDIAAVEAARAAYDALSETEQASFSSELYSKLILAEASAKAAKIDSVESLKITASSSAKKGSITVKWTVSGDTTYVEAFEIWKSTKRFSGFKKSFTTSSGTKRTYKNTKNLKSGTRYYYKVRAIAYVDGTKVKSSWSNKAYRKAK